MISFVHCCGTVRVHVHVCVASYARRELAKTGRVSAEARIHEKRSAD